MYTVYKKWWQHPFFSTDSKYSKRYDAARCHGPKLKHRKEPRLPTPQQNILRRRLGCFTGLCQRNFVGRTVSPTKESLRKPLFSRSVLMKASETTSSRKGLQQQHVSSTHTPQAFAHEIDLLDVLALDLNTNDFPLFLSLHSIFPFLEAIESIFVAFEHREFNYKIMTKRVEGVHDKMHGWLLSSFFSCPAYFLFLPAEIPPISLSDRLHLFSLILFSM